MDVSAVHGRVEKPFIINVIERDRSCQLFVQGDEVENDYPVIPQWSQFAEQAVFLRQ